MRTLTGSLRFLVDMMADRAFDCRYEGETRRVSGRRGFARRGGASRLGVP